MTSLESFVDAYLRGKDDSVSPVSEQECEAWIESIDKAIRSNYDSKWDARSIVNDAGWISYRTRANHATSPYASFLTKEDSEKFKKEQQDNSTENLRKIAGLYLKSLFSVAEKKAYGKCWQLLRKKRRDFMTHLRRTITILLILSLLGADVAPVLAAGGVPVRAAEKSNEVIPRFPEDAVQSQVDWSTIDWDRKVVLPEDEREYFKKLQELTSREGAKMLATITKPEEPMSADRIMSVYQVPLDVQDLVRAYRVDREQGFPPEKLQERKKVLSEDIKRLLESTGRLPSVREENVAQSSDTVSLPQKEQTIALEQKAPLPSTTPDLTDFAPIDLSGKKNHSTIQLKLSVKILV